MAESPVKPSISVVVAFYNIAACVSYCMESLLVQTYGGEYEILCVDDGSTDSTGEILDGYADRGHVRVLH